MKNVGEVLGFIYFLSKAQNCNCIIAMGVTITSGSAGRSSPIMNGESSCLGVLPNL